MSKNPLRDLSYGVYAVTTKAEGKAAGCIANSVMQITSKPATVAVSVNHDNFTNGIIKASKSFAISILPEDVDVNVIGTFGFKSCRDTDKFASLPFTEKSAIPVYDKACGYLVCKVISELETETHTIFLGEVIDSGELCGGAPMTYAYYHNVIKGKSPKNAPTYIEENASDEKWVCSICGYEYSGDTPFESLPDDYKCPICTVPKSMFKKK